MSTTENLSTDFFTRDEAEETTAPSTAVNTTTKAELLSRAKAAIEASDSSLRNAAEALALAQGDFNATQREIAAAVGKSVAWVNRLLQWQREDCQGTPFGPGSKASRKRRKRVQATEQGPPHKADADHAEASAEKRKAEYAKQEADAGTSTSTDAKATSTNAKASGDALAEFKCAVDQYVPRMDRAAKKEATDYFLKKTGEGVS